MIVSKLKLLLERKGWTLYRLQKKSGVSYPTLLALRDSKTTMFRADVIEKLCVAFNCVPGDLIGLSSRKTPQPPLRKRRSK